MPGSITRRRSDEGRASLLARAFNCFLAGPRIGLWQAGRRRRRRHQTFLVLLAGCGGERALAVDDGSAQHPS